MLAPLCDNVPDGPLSASGRDTLSLWEIWNTGMLFLTHLSQLVLHAYLSHQYPALFGLVLIEEAGIPIPIPGDTLVMLAGAHQHKTLAYDSAILLLSSLAVFIGSSILYLVIRLKGRPLLEKYGRYIHLNQRRLEMLERWFIKRGRVAIILGRLIPGLRIPTTIMAGLADVPYSVYAPTAALAAVIWSLFYFWVGVALLHGWQLVSAYVAALLEDFTGSLVWVWLFLLLCVSGGTVHVGWRIWRLRARRRAAVRLPGAIVGPLSAIPSIPPVAQLSPLARKVAGHSHSHSAADTSATPV